MCVCVRACVRACVRVRIMRVRVFATVSGKTSFRHVHIPDISIVYRAKSSCLLQFCKVIAYKLWKEEHFVTMIIYNNVYFIDLFKVNFFISVI